METGKRLPWKQPSIEIRDEFLSKMQSLSTRFESELSEIVDESPIDDPVNLDENELKRLLNAGEFAAAFFLSRRLLTRGEQWAEPYLLQAQNGLESDDDIRIP